MNRNDLMAQLGKMQEQLAKAQEDIENKVAEATAGGGAVKVEVTGGYRVKSLTIDPEVIDPDDASMLEDLVIAAMIEALSQVQAMHAEPLAGLGALAGGIPGMPNIPGLGESGASPLGGEGAQTPVNRAARRAQKK